MNYIYVWLAFWAAWLPIVDHEMVQVERILKQDLKQCNVKVSNGTKQLSYSLLK